MMRSPAFQFYPDDFIGGTVHLSAAETGGYIRLLCYQWGNGRIPQSKMEQERVAGCVVSEVMLQKFQSGRNKRLEHERRKQAVYRKKQALNGSKGGRPRKETQNNPSLSFGLSETEPKKSSPSPSPSPVQSTVQSTPTLRAREPSSELPDRETAIAMTASVAVDPEFAGYVYDDWFGRGGRDGANIEVKWLHYVTKRWSRERMEWKEGTHKGKSHGTNRTNSRPDRNAGIVGHKPGRAERIIAKRKAREAAKATPPGDSVAT